jgi:DNA-binding NtrC family response regulator
MKETRRILIVDDERPILLTLEALLNRHGFQTELVALQQIDRTAAPQGRVQSPDNMERVTILRALAQCHGNKKKAAELLGMQRPMFYNKLKRYAIEL